MQGPAGGILRQYIASLAEQAQKRIAAQQAPAAPARVMPSAPRPMPAPTPPPVRTPPMPAPGAPPPVVRPNTGGSGTLSIPSLPAPDIIGGLGNIKDNAIPTLGNVKDHPGETIGAPIGAALGAAQQKVQGDVLGEASFRIANMEDKKQQAAAIASIVTEMAARMTPGLNNPIMGGGSNNPFGDEFGSVSPSIPDWKGAVDGVQNFLTWSIANKDEVNAAHEQGGGNAVIQKFKEEQGDLPNLLFDLATDPLNYLGGIEKGILGAAGKMAPGIGRTAVSALGEAANFPDLMTDAALAATGWVGRQGAKQAKKTRIGGSIGKWFETDARTQATNLTNAVARALGQEDAAGVVKVADPNVVSTPVNPDLGPAYRHEPRPEYRGSREQAVAAMNDRLTTAADGDASLVASAVSDPAIADSLASVADEDVATNAFENWAAGFQAEDAVRKAGGTGEHVNNFPKNSVGYHLDELAYNPDPEARRAARQWLDGRGVPKDGSPEAVEDAIRMAQENPWNPANNGAVGADQIARNAANRHWNLMPNEDAQLLNYAVGQDTSWSRPIKMMDDRLRAASDDMIASWDAVSVAQREGRSDVDALRQAAEDREIAFRQESTRTQNMLEHIKRRADFIADYTARTGRDVTDPLNLRGLGQRADELDRSVEIRGPLAKEQDDLLNQTFSTTSKTNAGRTFRDVGREKLEQIRADKADLTRLLAKARQGSLDPKEAKRLGELVEKYPGVRTLGDVARINEKAAWKREMTREFREHLDVKDVNRFWRGVDTLTSNFSTLNLLAPWSAPRYWLGNLTGDSVQVGVRHGAEAAAAMLDPETQAVMMKHAVSGGNPLDSTAGRLYTDLGLGGFNDATMGDNLSEAMFTRLNGTMRKAAGRSTWNVPTRLADWGYFKQMRNVSNGMEWGRRVALHAHLLQKNVIHAQTDFVNEMAEYAMKAGGVDRRRFEEILASELGGPHFSGKDVAEAFGAEAMKNGRSADEVAKFADQMGRQWAGKVYKADKDALKSVNDALFDFDPKNIDTWVRRFVPFHMWATRALPFYAEQGMRHPGLANGYYALLQQTHQHAEEQGWPSYLQTYTKFWDGPGGIMLLFNPMAAVGLMDLALFSPEKTSEYDHPNAIMNALNTADKFGIGLAPIWKAMLDYSGMLGDDAPATDPIGLYQAENTVRTMIQFGINEGWLGEEAKGYLGRPLQQSLNNVRSMTTGWLSEHTPVEHIESLDAAAGDKRKITNRMLENEVESRGITMNDYLRLAMQAQANPNGPAAQQVTEIHQDVSDAFMDQGADYLRAVKEVSEGEAGAALIRSVLPGPKTTKQGTMLDIQAINAAAKAYEEGEEAAIPGLGPLPNPKKGDILNRVDKYSLAEHPELLDARDRAFLNNWAKMFGQEYRKGDLKRLLEAGRRENQWQNLSPEAATLFEQQYAYEQLGTKEERRKLKHHQAIMNGEVGVRLPDEDLNLTAEQVAAQDFSNRYALADAWLAKEDPDGELAKLKDAQALYIETHPEIQAWKDWARKSRKDWQDYGGVAAYRANEVQINPNYRAFINRETGRLRDQGKTVSQINEELNNFITFSDEAYFAYQGKSYGLYDPLPISTGQPSGLPPGAIADMTSGGGGGGSGSGSTTSWDSRVRTAIRATHDAAMKQYEIFGVTFDEVPPEIASVMRNEAPPEALEPSDKWIYDDYMLFYQQAVEAGTDWSIDAFIEKSNAEYAAEKQQDAIYEIKSNLANAS